MPVSRGTADRADSIDRAFAVHTGRGGLIRFWERISPRHWRVGLNGAMPDLDLTLREADVACHILASARRAAPATPDACGGAIGDLAERLAQLLEDYGDWNGGELVSIVDDWLRQQGYDPDATGTARRLPPADAECGGPA
jgi:hypothetical protein